MGRHDDPGYPQFGAQKFDVNRLYTNTPPMEAARLLVEAIQPHIDANPRIGVWSGPIEQHPENDAAMAWYGAFSYEFARLIWLQGKRAAVGGWATGTPDYALWDNWTLGLLASRKFRAYQSLHRYGPPYRLDANRRATAMPDLDNGLRYRTDMRHWRAMGFGDVEVLLEECGADDAGGEHCWKRYFDSLDHYWTAHLRPLALAVQQDDYVKLAAVFTCAGEGAWDCFNLNGTDIVERYVAPLAHELDKERMTMRIIILDDEPAALEQAVYEHLEALRNDVNENGRCLPYGEGASPQPLFWAVTLGAGLALRDSAGNPAHHPVYAPTGSPAGVVEPSTRIPIFAENVTAGAFTRRATITPEGHNIWMRDVPATTYRRE